MKRYEYVSRNYLTRRVPVIIRIDGKAFHTFTKGMRKPFDRVLMSAMQETMRFLCANIQGCVFGYTQSDEITLVLTDYASIRTDAWFGYSHEAEPSHVLTAMGLTADEARSSIRISFSRMNTADEAVDAANIIASCIEILANEVAK